MTKSWRALMVGGSALAGVLTVGSSVSAGGGDDFAFLSLFDETWSEWAYVDVPEADPGDATAAMGVQFFYDNCADLSRPVGSSRDFSFSVDARECFAPPAGVVTSTDTDYLPVGGFEWVLFDGEGVFTPVDCVEVQIDIETDGDLEAGVSFDGDEFSPSAYQVVTDGGIFLLFGVEDAAPEDGDGIWDVTVEIDDCGSTSGIGLDWGHYLRKPAETTPKTAAALPNTL